MEHFRSETNTLGRQVNTLGDRCHEQNTERGERDEHIGGEMNILEDRRAQWERDKHSERQMNTLGERKAH